MTHKIPLGALVLALAFEGLVYGIVPGIGYLMLWSTAFLVTVYLLKKAERRPRSLWMFLPSLLLTGSLFLYDATVVRFWSTSLGLITLAWAVAWNLVLEREKDALARLFPQATFHPGRWGRSLNQTWQNNIRWQPEHSKALGRTLRGLALAAPLLLVFGALLSSADAVFARSLNSLFQSGTEVSLVSPLRVLVWLALFSGWLRLWLMSAKQSAPQPRSWFGFTELMIALGSLNVMLVGFLLIQVRYLFGDTSAVEALGLTYAQYARKGFFELSICIALILPLVLTAYRAAESRADARLRYLGGGLILSAGGLAVTAFQRMLMYIEVFGLSVERFYAASGILVAMTVLGWAAWCCLSPRPVAWLLTRQTVTVLVLLGCLSLFIVEARIAEFNLERRVSGEHTVDLSYLSTLSTDVLPVLEAYYPRLGAEDQQRLVWAYAVILQGRDASSGASWNLSRSRPAIEQGEFANRVAQDLARRTSTVAEEAPYETALAHRSLSDPDPDRMESARPADASL